ncbi:hypothetical protein DKX38_026236 [Salix brachista]|uniref:Cupin type-1 domain-containing protein n=1 Tax=Salix brachista TaxID=2182728 RepID=A0A5N5K3T6_9ROSI|nr:hypothetical protein DKX38_026236 [Salix brachista]
MQLKGNANSSSDARDQFGCLKDYNVFMKYHNVLLQVAISRLERNSLDLNPCWWLVAAQEDQDGKPNFGYCECLRHCLCFGHFQRNGGQESAFLISSLSSQNPGGLLVANTLFGSAPSIPNDILAKAFQLDKSEVEKFQAQF